MGLAEISETGQEPPSPVRPIMNGPGTGIPQWEKLGSPDRSWGVEEEGPGALYQAGGRGVRTLPVLSNPHRTEGRVSQVRGKEPTACVRG